jgi:putative acetyltransferase
MPPTPAPAVSAIRIFEAATPADWAQVRAIFGEYIDGLGIDLAFQNVAAELADLPGAYAAPGGAVLLASVDGAIAGCGAFRPWAGADHPQACEMKRLYVRPAWRGLRLGRRIAEALQQAARERGHRAMLLDVFEHMAAARALYAALGFVEIAPYYANPRADVRYLKATLARGGAGACV